MEYIYKANIQLDLGEAVAEVGSFIEKLNAVLATYGRDEKIKISSDIFSMDVTVNRELTTKEKEKMKNILQQVIDETIPEYPLLVTSFGRKSGNVVQSVS